MGKGLTDAYYSAVFMWLWNIHKCINLLHDDKVMHGVSAFILKNPEIYDD